MVVVANVPTALRSPEPESAAASALCEPGAIVPEATPVLDGSSCTPSEGFCVGIGASVTPCDPPPQALNSRLTKTKKTERFLPFILRAIRRATDKNFHTTRACRQYLTTRHNAAVQADGRARFENDESMKTRAHVRGGGSLGRPAPKPSPLLRI